MTLSRQDQFAELLSQGLSLVQIRERMRLTKGQASGYFRRIRDKLGWQAC